MNFKDELRFEGDQIQTKTTRIRDVKTENYVLKHKDNVELIKNNSWR